MSDDDDWDFAGADDAKLTIRAAIRYLLKGTTDGVRGDIVQQIITIVRRFQTSHLASRIPWTMTYPADSPIFMVLGTYYDADHAAKSLSDCVVRNWGTRRDGTEIDLLLAGDYWPRLTRNTRHSRNGFSTGL